MLHPLHKGHQTAGNAWLRCLVGLAALGCLTGCAPGTVEKPLEEYNIVLITVDTLAAKYVGAYEPSLNHTPRIDAFAAANTRFSRAYSTAPWTQPSVASLFTSLMPSGHGVQNIRDVLDPEQLTLAEQLRDRGYATRGVVSHHLIGAALGYDQGFDDYDESAAGGHTVITSKQVTDSAIRQIDEHLDSPFFLFVHYFDPHYNYQHHPPFDRTSSYRGRLREADDIWDIRGMRSELDAADIDFLRGRHLEEIAFVDHHVGRLLDHLSASGLSESTIVVFVSDHGEEIMEHGWIGHTRTLYEELIHVPLVVRIPGLTEPRVVDEPVSTLDILPTLLSLSRTAADDRTWEGRSWLPFLLEGRDFPTGREIFAEVSFMPPSIRQAEKLAFKSALIQGDLKIVHDRKDDTWEMYRPLSDPAERTDLAGTEPVDLQRMSRRLAEWEATQNLPGEFTPAPPEGVSEEELERLRGLGYVR